MGFQQLKLGWDLDLVLLADWGINGACEIYEWRELMRIPVCAKKIAGLFWVGGTRAQVE